MIERWECRTGGSNKFYEFELQRNGGQRFTVIGRYGAIGRAPSEITIYDGDIEAEAVLALEKKKTEKRKHRYLPVGVESEDEVAPQVYRAEAMAVIWPMAANGAKDEDHVHELNHNGLYVAQEKLDGMRAIIHVRPDGLRIFSRNAGVNDPTRPLEKTTSLPHLAAIRLPHLAGTILDCELLATGMAAAETSGQVNSRFGSRDVRAYVFDCISLCGQTLVDVGLAARIKTLGALGLERREHFTLPPYYWTTDEKEELYCRIFSNGGKGEGVMFKHRLGAYYPGGRPTGVWWKVKKKAQFDVIIMGFTKGEGKYNETVGAIRFGQYVGGKLTELGQTSGMTDYLRDKIHADEANFIGRVMMVEAQERLTSGALRHPRFKGWSEKQPAECVWYRGEQ